jgi:hypothetical protein
MSANAFCCASVIPSSFTHLLDLVPKNTSHTLLDRSSSSSALISSFLAAISSNRIYSATSTPPPIPIAWLSNASYRAIIQVRRGIVASPSPYNVSEVSRAYYVQYGRHDRETIQRGGREYLHGQIWREIPEHQADSCLRPPGSGVEIGDGEQWMELTGIEMLWCENHKVFWELRAWVRET